MKKKAVYPSKTSMNLFYKPDRTTKPATAALYVLFALVCLLGLSKLLVYDLWMEKQAAEQGYEMALEELADITIQLEDYDTAKGILRQLHDSLYRCMLNNITVSLGRGNDGSVSVSGSIVYFECQTA